MESEKVPCTPDMMLNLGKLLERLHGCEPEGSFLIGCQYCGRPSNSIKILLEENPDACK